MSFKKIINFVILTNLFKTWVDNHFLALAVHTKIHNHSPPDFIRLLLLPLLFPNIKSNCPNFSPKTFFWIGIIFLAKLVTAAREGHVNWRSWAKGEAASISPDRVFEGPGGNRSFQINLLLKRLKLVSNSLTVQYFHLELTNYGYILIFFEVICRQGF